ncbi:MAG: acetyltransferase [Bacteroidetes bacterium]|nr:acetyltransferase [Fibrella sp.]
MKNIAIYGAGGLGREMLLLIQQINRVLPTWTVAGFFDDGVPAGTMINGFSVLGNLKTLNQWPDALAVILAIGKPGVKQAVVEQIINPTVWYPILIHPSVAVADENVTVIGEGSILSAGTILTTNITMGRHVFVNLKCTIGHDVVLSDFCALMPGVSVSGEVGLGEGVYVGTGAILLNRITIGANTIIGAGAVVTRSLPNNCTAVGVPARPQFPVSIP